MNSFKLFFVSIIVAAMAAPVLAAMDRDATSGNYVLAVHGGSGAPAQLDPELLQQYREALTEALRAGYKEIEEGRSSLDAVEAAIVIMEDSPLFNAGKGAVFTNDGKNELDASIMTGDGLDAGAVAGVTTVKNPIRAARAVMEETPHVLLSGPGANVFAEGQDLEKVDPEYFRTERRWNALQRAIERERSEGASLPGSSEEDADIRTLGTVGAVALDKDGNLAAGTSTGGMNNKRHGRIGDSPIIGAGTYASNETVAVSGTGWGEKFIRTSAAYTVSALMAYQELSVKDASQRALDNVAAIDGYGGLIAIDREGNVAMPFNTRGMFRGAVTKDGEIEIYIHDEEEPWRPE